MEGRPDGGTVNPETEAPSMMRLCAPSSAKKPAPGPAALTFTIKTKGVSHTLTNTGAATATNEQFTTPSDGSARPDELFITRFCTSMVAVTMLCEQSRFRKSTFSRKLNAPLSATAAAQHWEPEPSITMFRSVTEFPSTLKSVHDVDAFPDRAKENVVGVGPAPATRKPIARFTGSTSDVVNETEGR